MFLFVCFNLKKSISVVCICLSECILAFYIYQLAFDWIGFRSSFWLGHCNTWTHFTINYSTFQAVCFGSASSWKVNHHLSLKSFTASNKISSGLTLYLATFIFPLTLSPFTVPCEEKPTVQSYSYLFVPRWCIQGTFSFSLLMLAMCSLWLLENFKHWVLFFLSVFLSLGLILWLSPRHSFMKSRFAECNRFSHLSCLSLQVLQSYHGSLSCFSDLSSPCPVCWVTGTARSW